ncbi:MAG TPA: sulfurtransferase [Dyella sp.]|uniref:sulfurtransferase n=1 Tax=Dyella sp. TaxID=1869338 RepID=UPI002F94FBB8
MKLYTTLISVEALAALPAEHVLIVDCRIDLADRTKGDMDYRQGHIPGAVYANLETDLSDLSRSTQGLGRHPLPSEKAFAALLARWGWRRGMQIVSYDAASGSLAAARLWWMLRLTGVRDVAVLDGGYPAWLASGKPVETRLPERASTHVSLRFDPDEVLFEYEPGARPESLMIDARATQRFRGEVEPLDPVAGHVPGARNRPFTANLDEHGYFKSAEVLREEFLAVLGEHRPEDVVHMCGSGVTACHNLLAMEHAGLHGSRLYAPSWSGWLSDRSRPVATGD